FDRRLPKHRMRFVRRGIDRPLRVVLGRHNSHPWLPAASCMHACRTIEYRRRFRPARQLRRPAARQDENLLHGRKEPRMINSRSLRLDRVTRAPLADAVYETLLDGILGGRYAAGAELTEVALADELGVSRTPVHDALKRLAVDGLIE